MLGSKILSIFGDSPIKPIQHHMNKIYECVMMLESFFNSILESNFDEAEKIHDKIMNLEAEADVLKKDIRLHISGNVFMAIGKHELLSLLTTQDKIASKAKHIASTVFSRKMEIPKEIKESYFSLVSRCIAAASQADKIINELDDLVETGFSGNQAKIVEKMISELEDIERETDILQLELRSSLFEIENSLEPVKVVFLYKTIDWLGDLADRAQNVGHRLESLLSSS